MPLEEKFCPLCGRAAVIVRLTPKDSYRIDCECCGTFSFTRILWRILDVSRISDDDIRLFDYLPSYTRQMSESGTPAELDTGNWRACAQRHLSTPIAQKIKKCVDLIAKRAGSYGNDVDITPTLDYPLVDVNSAEALESLLQELQKKDYVTCRGSSGRLTCSLTIAGWEYLDQRTTAANREESQGTHINVSGGTIYGNIVGNVSGENAGIQYTSHAVPAREIPAPTPRPPLPSKSARMPRVFLCHANEDKPQVRAVHQRLKAEGFQPWLDEEDLLPGQLWDQEIRKALRSSDFILIFFSQTSITKRGYVQREMKLALDTWEEVPEGHIHTIPIRLDACQIPERFKPFQWVDLFGDGSWERLIRAIRFGLEQRQQSEPALRQPAPLQDATGTVTKRNTTTAPLSTGITYVAMDFSPLDRIGTVEAIDTRLGSLLPQSLVSINMEFVRIPAGEFLMGSTDYHAHSDEQPVHTVHIRQPFYLGKYPVTQAQWEAVMQNNPSHFKGDPQRPVESVSWDDVQEFIRKLNERERGVRYRLPTEAEWEYAARAGSTTVYSFGDDREQLGAYAWYEQNAGGTTHPVGQLKPNGWGLYDMHGNVCEWVQDWHGDYPHGTVTDPQGATSGSSRVNRGGNWLSDARHCRSARRLSGAPTGRHNGLGFRLDRESSSSLTFHYAPRV